MKEKDDITKLVIKLIKLTEKDQIRWVSTTPPHNKLGHERVLGKVYTTEYKHNHLRIYQYRYDVFPSPVISSSDMEVVTSVAFELIDYQGHIENELPFSNSLNDLYKVVRDKCSNIGEVIKDMLSD